MVTFIISSSLYSIPSNYDRKHIRVSAFENLSGLKAEVFSQVNFPCPLTYRIGKIDCLLRRDRHRAVTGGGRQSVFPEKNRNIFINGVGAKLPVSNTCLDEIAIADWSSRWDKRLPQVSDSSHSGEHSPLS